MTGPDPFFDPDAPPLVESVNQQLPKSEGGVIEAVKRAVVTALREALNGTNLRLNGRPVYVDLEYPLAETQYPGIWIQFSTTRLSRAGIGHEWPIKEDGEWHLIQEWMFEGRITFSIVALKSLDRDRLADMLIANLAFARTPDLIITDPTKDTKKFKSLMTTLGENPYIRMTLNTDLINSGGQGVDVGVPWSPEDVLAYTDSYSVDLMGQFNIKFTHEGVYELARIDIDPHMVDHIPPRASHRVDFTPDNGWQTTL